MFRKTSRWRFWINYLLVGEDVVDEEVEEIESYIEDNFDAEVDIIEGKQPVYSFIIGVE